MWFRRRRKPSDADKALAEAQEKLAEVQQRGCEVTKVAAALKEIRERNHFADKLEEIFFGGGQTR